MPEYGWRTREVRERNKQGHWPSLLSTCEPRVPHVEDTPLPTCATCGGHPSAHVCHTWKVMWPFLIGHRIPSLLHLFSLHIYSKSRAEFSTTFDFLFWSYLSQINSELSDSKTKIVGLDERNKPQAFSESNDFVIVRSKLISVRDYTFVGETFSYHFHLLIFSLIFLFDRWFVFRMMLVHMLGLYDWLICWVLVLNLIWAYFTKLDLSWNWF